MIQRAAKWSFAFILVLPFLASPPSAHKEVRLCGGFAPPNDLKIYADDADAKGLPEAAFNSVLDKVEAAYAPIFRAKGAKLVVRRRWTDPTVNAFALQRGRDWEIHMYGGLARHHAVTPEGFALVACHEIGHHLGGFPKAEGSWATNEGGSDYFANLKCMRRVLGADAPASAAPAARAACVKAFPEGAERNRCEGGAMAGLSAALLLNELGRGAKDPAFDTPDRSVAPRMNHAHPKAQCRLDTYFQGALCRRGIDEELSDGDPAPGACTAEAGFDAGLRPLCWYKPPASGGRLLSSLGLPDAAAMSGRLRASADALGGI